MLKNKILVVLVTLIVPCLLKAAESEKIDTFFYGKMGANYDSKMDDCINRPFYKEIRPTAGIGARFRKDSVGADVSLNGVYGGLYSDVSAKANLLVYPDQKKQVYMGLGGGLNLPGSLKGGKLSPLSAEGVIGYEFENRNWGRKFVQLELSNPIKEFKPAIAATFGIGF